MVITANQTGQLPQAPSTPVVAQQALSELVNYYRELAHFHRSSVDYHRQLLEQHSQDAEVAEKQLASIEAMLHPLTRGSVNQDAKGKQVKGTGKIASLEVKAKETVSEGASDTLAVPKVTTVESEVEEAKVEETTTKAKKPETKTSQAVTQSSSQKNGKTKSISSQARKTKKPTKKKSTRPTKKTTKAHSARLPHSDKLAARETIVDAVAVCLQEYYPQVISAEDVVKYYYPEGLEGEARKKAYRAFSNCLSKGAGKQGWFRVSIGKYHWKNEG